MKLTCLRPQHFQVPQTSLQVQSPSLLPSVRDNGSEGELGDFQAEDLGLTWKAT